MLFYSSILYLGMFVIVGSHFFEKVILELINRIRIQIKLIPHPVAASISPLRRV